MSLKGDASQIPLSNIFQTLQLNGQEGVLTVSLGKTRRKVRALPNGVRLLASSRDNPDVLRMALVKQKIVTESQFQNIISTMGQPFLFPGEFLIQRRILTRAQVENDVLRQFQELLFEIFSWKKAKYEFVAGDPGDDLELFDPAELGQLLVFNIPGVLMEVARRDDEWKRIREAIPSEREIFVPADRQAFHKPKSYAGDVDAKALQEVKKLIDGERNVESISAESTLSSFEVFRTLTFLLVRKEIRPLSVKEKKDLAEELRKKFKVKEVVEIYRHLLECTPEDIEIRLKLVQILERKKESSAFLVEQYQFLADHFFKAGECAQALSYLEKILQADRLHLDALDKLFDIHYLSKNHKDAVETARRVVEAVKARKEFERGAEILLKVLDLYPEESVLFHDLADFFIFSNQSDQAVLALKSVAGIYEERGDLTKLRKTYERIASINPAEAPNLRKILEAERRSTRPMRSFLVPSRSLAWIVLGVAVFLGIAYLGTLEVLARTAYARVRKDVDACVKAGDYQKARAILEDISRRYPVTTLWGQISKETSELSSRERERDAQRRKHEEKEKVQFGSFLARLETLMLQKRYTEALALVEETSRQTLNAENRRKIAAAEAEIRQYFTEAAQMAQQSRDLVQAGKHEEAHRAALKLLMNYSSTPAAQGLKFPLLVKSSPPGAAVSLNGEAVGTTPMTLYYDPVAKIQLTVAKEGFRPVLYGEGTGERRPIDCTKDWMVLARLERVPAWVFDAQAPVECTPLVRDDKVYFGTRGGRIYCLDRNKGTVAWTYDVPDGWDVASGLRAYLDRICFGTFQGVFHILGEKGGKVLHRLTPLSPPRPIRHPASEPTVNGLVAVNCGGAAVAMVDLNAGTTVWTFRYDTEILGPPELHDGFILFAAADGSIFSIDPATGSLAGRYQLNARLGAAGKAAEGSYIVGDAAGHIRSVNLKTGAIQWTYESPMENLTPPAVGSGLALFGSGKGFYAALDARNGDLRWRGKLNDALLAPASWSNGSFFLGTKGGQALSLEASTGAVSWAFTAGGPFAATPGAGGNLILLGSDDHKVYAFVEK